jgi:hypothetical protein
MNLRNLLNTRPHTHTHIYIYIYSLFLSHRTAAVPAGSCRTISAARLRKRLKTPSVVWPDADSTNTTSCVLKGSQYVGSGSGVGVGAGARAVEETAARMDEL